ncbi:hypothetical protein QBC43DRAFT_83657 [Cladorrhinum sp. PSN259]|nr:hypothetical protein QBC43DRAFT_83657 [Cladorrhinum sp. PSN259]
MSLCCITKPGIKAGGGGKPGHLQASPDFPFRHLPADLHHSHLSILGQLASLLASQLPRPSYSWPTWSSGLRTSETGCADDAHDTVMAHCMRALCGAHFTLGPLQVKGVCLQGVGQCNGVKKATSCRIRSLCFPSGRASSRDKATRPRFYGLCNKPSWDAFEQMPPLSAVDCQFGTKEIIHSAQHFGEFNDQGRRDKRMQDSSAVPRHARSMSWSSPQCQIFVTMGLTAWMHELTVMARRFDDVERCEV